MFFFTHFIDQLIPEKLKGNILNLYKARLFVTFWAFEFLTFSLVGSYEYYTQGYLYYLMLVARLIVLGVFTISKRHELPVNLLIGVYTLSIFGGVMIEHEVHLSYFLISITSAFLIQILLEKSKWLFLWIVVYVVLLSVESYEHGRILGSLEYTGEKVALVFFLTLTKLSLLVAGQQLIFRVTRKDLEDFRKEKEYVTSVVSHDLKSPFNRILGFGKIIKMSGDLSKSQSGELDACISEVENARHYVDEIMDEAREDVEDIMVQEFDLSNVCIESETNKIMQSLSTGVSIRVNRKCDDSVMVNSSEEHIRRLIDYTFDYLLNQTEKGGKIECEIANEGNLVKVQFETNSVKKDILTSSTYNTLSMAKVLAQKMRGKLTTSSPHENGLKITLEFERNPWNSVNLRKSSKSNSTSLLAQFESFFIPPKLKINLAEFVRTKLFIRFVSFFVLLTLAHRISSYLLQSDYVYLPATGYLFFITGAMGLLFLLKRSENLNLAANISITFMFTVVISSIIATHTFRVLDFILIIIAYSLMVTFSNRRWAWIWAFIIPVATGATIVYLTSFSQMELSSQMLTQNALFKFLLFTLLAFMLIWGKDQAHKILIMQNKEFEALKGSFIFATANGLRKINKHINEHLVNIRSAGELNEEQMAMITMSLTELKKCGKLIDNIRSSHEKEQDENPLIERVDLGGLLQQVTDSFQQQAITKQIKLEYENSYNQVVKIDKTGLQRVLDNLISNALKFSSQNKKVWVRLSGDESEFTIQVEDQGPGISAEDQEKLFKMFQKLSAKPTGGESSHGVGLSSAKNLVERMNGSIGVESALGRGSCFSITIPTIRLVTAADEQLGHLTDMKMVSSAS